MDIDWSMREIYYIKSKSNTPAKSTESIDKMMRDSIFQYEYQYVVNNNMVLTRDGIGFASLYHQSGAPDGEE
jgi:hypothetical protein